MSGYEVGAFEALEWAWNLLRAQSGSNGIREATTRIQEALFTLGSGSQVDFRRKTNDLIGLS